MMASIFFEDTIKCQSGKDEMNIKFGRSSKYIEDSIYFNVDGKEIVMDPKIARKFVEAAGSLGRYYGFDRGW